MLCQNHGPFAWGKDAAEAVHNAVVLEEVAKMARLTESVNPDVKPAPDNIKEKHFYRKHGANAYYGQNCICSCYTARSIHIICVYIAQKMC